VSWLGSRVSQHKSHVFSGVWLEDFFPLGILQVRCRPHGLCLSCTYNYSNSSTCV